MALLLAEGFDQYPNNTVLTAAATSGRYSVASGTVKTDVVRTGSVAALQGSVRRVVTGLTTFTVGGWWYVNFSSFTSNGVSLVSLWNDTTSTTSTGTTRAGGIQIYSDGSVAWYNDQLASTPVSGKSAAGVILPLTWVHIEAKVLKATTAVGTVEIRVNGVVVLTASGIITSDSGFVAVQWDAAHNTTFRMDDITLTDDGTTDAAGNTTTITGFVGPVQVKVLAPDSDAAAGWAIVSPVGSHYSTVDERGNVAAHDSDTSYVESDTVGAQDLFGLTALSVSGGVVAVQVSAVARKPTDGTSQVKLVQNHGGITQASAGKALTTTFSEVLAIFERRPDAPSSPYTSTEIATLAIGVEVA